MIDFSCKHDVMIEDPDGTLRPMDEPYFISEKIAPGTWRVRSDGDSSYLLEGSEQAIVIDSGYGAGSIRDYCQSLTDKPVKYIINTHDHFDHTANNSYFEKAYMTAASKELATIPFPSFEGIDFPRDYPVEIVKDGDVIDIGDRPLEIFELPDHAVGSIAILDTKQRILFSGDEINGGFKMINTTAENVRKQFQHIWDRKDDFDIICSGTSQTSPASVIQTYLDIFDEILAGNPGTPGFGFGGGGPQDKKKEHDPDMVVYERFHARPCDMKIEKDKKDLRHIKKDGIMVMFTPDNVR